MDENPRIADLRKKLEKDPASRLFAQLAKELRKEGRHEEAIQVAYAGLERHPNYPSARLTLARAILDTGYFAEARPELEQVVKASPDNIMTGACWPRLWCNWAKTRLPSSSSSAL